MRLCTILLRAAMEMMLAFMNHFPLFALTLRVKDPWRLPGRHLPFRFHEVYLFKGRLLVRWRIFGRRVES